MAFIKAKKIAQSSGTVMTVILDLTNSDPTSWATYADDAVGMTAGSDDWDTFFGHYPCILNAGVELGKLKRDDFTKYEDGTTRPTGLGNDVMICFPKRGIKIQYLDANTLSVSMTDAEGVTGYSYMAHSYKGNPISKFYLGAYKGYVSSNKLYSSSGKTPTTSKTIGDFRTYAQARGTGYEQSGFFQLTYRQVMYLLKYKGQNSQATIGKGYVGSNSSAKSTGGTNTKGMDWGSAATTYQVKLFGIEDFYGNVTEMIEGCYCKSSSDIDIKGKLYVADGNFNDDGTGYTDAGTLSFSSTFSLSGFLRYPNGTNLAGFTHNTLETYGGSTSYFCDRVSIGAGKHIGFGGYYSGLDTSPGVFNNEFNMSSTTSNTQYGSRLMYLGG